MLILFIRNQPILRNYGTSHFTAQPSCKLTASFGNLQVTLWQAQVYQSGLLKNRRWQLKELYELPNMLIPDRMNVNFLDDILFFYLLKCDLTAGSKKWRGLE
eukprot:TRINITY_DN37282_c0_g1_i1.p1 TRINITY_DN37282_c0_g1~~TRINITY_DN37282_c0_g1_i1.p1  ORF type:complete len:102 (+),score=3.35 TRINITY_DN37282_c0_g1_i1:213-518(+)